MRNYGDYFMNLLRVTLLTAFLFVTLFSPFAQASLWQERTQKREQKNQQDQSAAALLQQMSYVGEGRFVSRFAKEVARSQSNSSQLPEVFLIQDTHRNAAAQMAAAQFLKEVLSQQGRLDIYSEGATKPLAFAWTHYLSDQKTLAATAKNWIQNLNLTAEEYLALTEGPNKITITGIEDPVLFAADHMSRREVSASKAKILSRLGQYESDFSALLNRKLPASVYQALMKKQDWQNGRCDPLTYAKFLADRMGGQQYDSIRQLVALDQQKVSAAQLQSELNHLLTQLRQILPENEQKILMQKMLEFRLGKIPAQRYYQLLSGLGKIYGIPAKTLAMAIELETRQSQLQVADLSQDLEECADLWIARLALSQEEKNLNPEFALEQEWMTKNPGIFLSGTPRAYPPVRSRRSSQKYSQDFCPPFLSNANSGLIAAWNFLILEQRFWAGTLSMPQYRAYQTAAQHFTVSSIERILSNAGVELLQGSALQSEPWSYLQLRHLQKQFYSLAAQRDRALAENFLQRLRSSTNKTQSVALIAGGFHAEGIADILKKNGVGIRVYLPTWQALNSATTEPKESEVGAQVLQQFVQAERTAVDLRSYKENLRQALDQPNLSKVEKAQIQNVLAMLERSQLFLSRQGNQVLAEWKSLGDSASWVLRLGGQPQFAANIAAERHTLRDHLNLSEPRFPQLFVITDAVASGYNSPIGSFYRIPSNSSLSAMSVGVTPSARKFERWSSIASFSPASDHKNISAEKKKEQKRKQEITTQIYKTAFQITIINAILIPILLFTNQKDAALILALVVSLSNLGVDVMKVWVKTNGKIARWKRPFFANTQEKFDSYQTARMATVISTLLLAGSVTLQIFGINGMGDVFLLAALGVATFGDSVKFFKIYGWYKSGKNEISLFKLRTYAGSLLPLFLMLSGAILFLYGEESASSILRFAPIALAVWSDYCKNILHDPRYNGSGNLKKAVPADTSVAAAVSVFPIPQLPVPADKAPQARALMQALFSILLLPSSFLPELYLLFVPGIALGLLFASGSFSDGANGGASFQPKFADRNRSVKQQNNSQLFKNTTGMRSAFIDTKAPALTGKPAAAGERYYYREQKGQKNLGNSLVNRTHFSRVKNGIFTVADQMGSNVEFRYGVGQEEFFYANPRQGWQQGSGGRILAPMGLWAGRLFQPQGNEIDAARYFNGIGLAFKFYHGYNVSSTQMVGQVSSLEQAGKQVSPLLRAHTLPAGRSALTKEIEQSPAVSIGASIAGFFKNWAVRGVQNLKKIFLWIARFYRNAAISESVQFKAEHSAASERPGSGRLSSIASNFQGISLEENGKKSSSRFSRFAVIQEEEERQSWGALNGASRIGRTRTAQTVSKASLSEKENKTAGFTITRRSRLTPKKENSKLTFSWFRPLSLFSKEGSQENAKQNTDKILSQEEVTTSVERSAARVVVAQMPQGKSSPLLIAIDIKENSQRSAIEAAQKIILAARQAGQDSRGVLFSVFSPNPDLLEELGLSEEEILNAKDASKVIQIADGSLGSAQVIAVSAHPEEWRSYLERVVLVDLSQGENVRAFFGRTIAFQIPSRSPDFVAQIREFLRQH